MEDEVMEDELRLLGNLAIALDMVVQEELGQERGFFILLFDLNEPFKCNFASNVSRELVVRGLRETADKIEAGQLLPPKPGSFH